ncbi:hypothetical protein WR25_25511 [Diploscapter pachys]|uniref:Serine/threonine-protein kinase D1-3-like ubiquitin-like domain-containing protein n=1 Tax=Diploscapter pachys TaxID=2018661 RepID=A0A2A2JFS1_9BILA|nr:hypothetical protein WR25_25511 [Diploscapter pachys]
MDRVLAFLGCAYASASSQADPSTSIPVPPYLAHSANYSNSNYISSFHSVPIISHPSVSRLSTLSSCSDTSTATMSGLSFQLQSGIHKRSITVDASEISPRDLRNEAYQFIQKLYPTHDCASMQDHILLYKHDLRSINILQLITTSSDVVDGTLVEVVISCELFFI